MDIVKNIPDRDGIRLELLRVLQIAAVEFADDPPQILFDAELGGRLASCQGFVRIGVPKIVIAAGLSERDRLSACIHESAHLLEFFGSPPPADPVDFHRMIKLLNTSPAADPTRGPDLHTVRWHRIAAIMLNRIGLAGEHFAVPDQDILKWGEMMDATAAESRAMQGRRFTEILNLPSSPEFADAWSSHCEIKAVSDPDRRAFWLSEKIIPTESAAIVAA